MQTKIIRRFTRRVYSNYGVGNYTPSVDNLNPQNPSELEGQLEDMVTNVKERVVNAYEKAGVEPPNYLFDSEGTSPTAVLGAIGDLLNRAKMGNNPLADLVKLGIPDLKPFLTDPEDADRIMGNPLVLDCEGVEKTLLATSYANEDNKSSNNEGDSESEQEGDSSDEDDDSDDDSGNSSSDEESSDGEKKFKITYVVENGTNPNNPEEYGSSDCPFTLAPAVANEGYEFKGWFSSSLYIERITEVSDMQKDITLYAKIEKQGDDTPEEDEDGDPPPDLSLGDSDDEGSECDKIELVWLMIIMIIVVIVQILVKVLILVYNIQKVKADILKEAQLCWINPPVLESMIAYIIQRLSALIFSLIGIIFAKLWAMLNMDCVVDSVNDMVDQINSVISSITSTFGEIDGLALNLKALGDSEEGGILDALKRMKEQMINQVEEFKKNWSIENLSKQITDSLGGAAAEWQILLTNPDLLYDQAVPPEIQQKVQSLLDSYQATMNNIDSMTSTYTKMSKSVGEAMQGDNLKNVGKRIFS